VLGQSLEFLLKMFVKVCPWIAMALKNYSSRNQPSSILFTFLQWRISPSQSYV